MDNPKFTKYSQNVNPTYLQLPIWLKRSKMNVFYDLLKGDFQNKYWYRHSNLKNILCSFLFVLLWVFITYKVFELLLTMTKLPININQSTIEKYNLYLGFLGSLSVVYWNYTSKYGQLWVYCAGVFNKIFYDKFPSSSPIEHLYRKTTFALDLIDCNMWHHKSFFNDFNYIVECSIEYALCDDSMAKVKINEILKGKGALLEIRGFVSNLQNALELHLHQPIIGEQPKICQFKITGT